MEQLELVYDDRPGKGPSGEIWSHRMERQSLVVDTDNYTLIFGHWSDLYGTWATDRSNGTTVELIHQWNPFNRLGNFEKDQDLNRRSRYSPFPRHWLAWCEICSGFIAYFSQIPLRIRRLVGQLGDHQWLALDLIWQEPEFAWFLEETIAQGRQHYFHACVELAGAADMSRLDRNGFARLLMYERGAVVLSTLTGDSHSRRSIRILVKIIDHSAWKREWYVEFLQLSLTRTGAKAMLHASDIGYLGLPLWRCLPEKLQSSSLLRVFFENVDEARSFIAEIEEFFNSLPDSILDRLKESLSSISRPCHLEYWVYDNLSRVVASLPFPLPPIPGTTELIPLASDTAMRHETRLMSNCVVQDVWGVRSGSRFYFHWQGLEEATVLLSRQGQEEWQFSEILGPNNEPVSQQTRLYVENLVGTQLKDTQGSDFSEVPSVHGLLNPLSANDNTSMTEVSSLSTLKPGDHVVLAGAISGQAIQ